MACSAGERRILIGAYAHSVALWDSPWIEISDKSMFHYKNKVEMAITKVKQIGRRPALLWGAYAGPDIDPQFVADFKTIKKYTWRIWRGCCESIPRRVLCAASTEAN